MAHHTNLSQLPPQSPIGSLWEELGDDIVLFTVRSYLSLRDRVCFAFASRHHASRAFGSERAARDYFGPIRLPAKEDEKDADERETNQRDGMLEVGPNIPRLPHEWVRAIQLAAFVYRTCHLRAVLGDVAVVTHANVKNTAAASALESALENLDAHLALERVARENFAARCLFREAVCLRSPDTALAIVFNVCELSHLNFGNLRLASSQDGALFSDATAAELSRLTCGLVGQQQKSDSRYARIIPESWSPPEPVHTAENTATEALPQREQSNGFSLRAGLRTLFKSLVTSRDEPATDRSSTAAEFATGSSEASTVNGWSFLGAREAMVTPACASSDLLHAEPLGNTPPYILPEAWYLDADATAYADRGGNHGSLFGTREVSRRIVVDMQSEPSAYADRGRQNHLASRTGAHAEEEGEFDPLCGPRPVDVSCTNSGAGEPKRQCLQLSAAIAGAMWDSPVVRPVAFHATTQSWTSNRYAWLDNPFGRMPLYTGPQTIYESSSPCGETLGATMHTWAIHMVAPFHHKSARVCAWERVKWALDASEWLDCRGSMRLVVDRVITPLLRMPRARCKAYEPIARAVGALVGAAVFMGRFPEASLTGAVDFDLVVDLFDLHADMCTADAGNITTDLPCAAIGFGNLSAAPRASAFIAHVALLAECDRARLAVMLDDAKMTKRYWTSLLPACTVPRGIATNRALVGALFCYAQTAAAVLNSGIRPIARARGACDDAQSIAVIRMIASERAKDDNNRDLPAYAILLLLAGATPHELAHADDLGASVSHCLDSADGIPERTLARHRWQVDISRRVQDARAALSAERWFALFTPQLLHKFYVGTFAAEYHAPAASADAHDVPQSYLASDKLALIIAAHAVALNRADEGDACMMLVARVLHAHAELAVSRGFFTVPRAPHSA